MRALDERVRHVFPNENFDGISFDTEFKPGCANPKDLYPEINNFKFQEYVGSLHKSFPDNFPKPDVQDIDLAQLHLARKATAGLRSIQVALL